MVGRWRLTLCRGHSVIVAWGAVADAAELTCEIEADSRVRLADRLAIQPLPRIVREISVGTAAKLC